MWGSGGPATTGAGVWRPVIDTAPGELAIGDYSADVNFDKPNGIITIASRPALAYYQFVATLGCRKGESGSNSVEIGISIDNADPIQGHFTTIAENGLTSTQREITVSGIFTLTPDSAHTIRLMVRQTGTTTANGVENSILFRTINLNLNTINAIGAGMGPQGPAGPVGPQGLQGETGPQGPQGLEGPMRPESLMDAVFIDAGSEESPVDGVYFRDGFGVGAYPAYKKYNSDNSVVTISSEPHPTLAGQFVWEVWHLGEGEPYYRSATIQATYPWQATEWEAVLAFGAFVSITQATVQVAARKFVAGVDTGGARQTGPFIILAEVAETGDYNDLSNKPGPFTGATSSENGAAGLVRAPVAGDEVKFLRGDGLWEVGPVGPTGPQGPAGPAPAGTGLVSVTNGVLDSPLTAVQRGLVTRFNVQGGTDSYFERVGDALSQEVALGVTQHQIVLANDSRLRQPQVIELTWNPAVSSNAGLNTDFMASYGASIFNSSIDHFSLENAGNSGTANNGARVHIKQTGFYRFDMQLYCYDLRENTELRMMLFRGTAALGVLAWDRLVARKRPAANAGTALSSEEASCVLRITGVNDRYNWAFNSQFTNPYMLADPGDNMATMRFQITFLRPL
jgi:hypothetical protein